MAPWTAAPRGCPAIERPTGRGEWWLDGTRYAWPLTAAFWAEPLERESIALDYPEPPGSRPAIRPALTTALSALPEARRAPLLASLLAAQDSMLRALAMDLLVTLPPARSRFPPPEGSAPALTAEQPAPEGPALEGSASHAPRRARHHPQ